MQYFVVIEDTKNQRWQGELLFESVRLLGLERHFVAAVCPGKGAVHKHPYPNIVYFDNLGSKLLFPHFNKCYGMLKALEHGAIRPPFTILDPDMFLIKEPPKYATAVVAQGKETIPDLDLGGEWVGLGGVYCFNECPPVVFEDVMRFTYDLYKKYGIRKEFHTYGFNLAIAKHGVPVHKANLEMPLINSKHTAPIVHYSEGYPPYFTKEGIYDTINFSFGLPLPFKTIMETPVRGQPNVALMQTLIRSWLDGNSARAANL